MYLHCTFLSCCYFSILFVLLTSPEIPIILKVILLHYLIPPNQVYMWQTISLLCPHSWRFNHFTISVIASSSEFLRKPASQLHFSEDWLGPLGIFCQKPQGANISRSFHLCPSFIATPAPWAAVNQ